MRTNWHPLEKELAAWRRAGLHLPLWWRDDDAVEVTSALDRLLYSSEKIGLSVHLAVIPKPATQALATHLAGTSRAVPVVHGWAHANHAPKGAKKAEFNHPRSGATAECQAALDRARELFGSALLPLFVPPWNRVSRSVTNALSPMGYTAISTFTPRSSAVISGLAQINTHIDPIYWKAGGGLGDINPLIQHITTLLKDRRMGRTDALEPLGFLTHHLVHDEAIWGFTETCLNVLLNGGATPCNRLTVTDDT